MRVTVKKYFKEADTHLCFNHETQETLRIDITCGIHPFDTSGIKCQEDYIEFCKSLVGKQLVLDNVNPWMYLADVESVKD